MLCGAQLGIRQPECVFPTLSPCSHFSLVTQLGPTWVRPWDSEWHLRLQPGATYWKSKVTQ